MSPKIILIAFGKNMCIRQILFEIREIHWIRPGNLLGTNLLWYLSGICFERAISMKSFGVIHSANVYYRLACARHCAHICSLFKLCLLPAVQSRLKLVNISMPQFLE